MRPNEAFAIWCSGSCDPKNCWMLKPNVISAVVTQEGVYYFLCGGSSEAW